MTFFTGIVELFLKKYPFPSTENQKSVITTVKGIGYLPRKAIWWNVKGKIKKIFWKKGNFNRPTVQKERKFDIRYGLPTLFHRVEFVLPDSIYS